MKYLVYLTAIATTAKELVLVREATLHHEQRLKPLRF